MYSGTTLTNFSGRIIGAHQKIDRVARKQLGLLIDDPHSFPSARLISHFEGKKGPDAIKIKSPAKDEPWHYYQPFDEKDSQLVELIQDHYDHLIIELKVQNVERSAFEAAWLAHALVDGLTPAHHFPYEQTLVELRGEGIETRTTVKSKLFMPGRTQKERIIKNWKVWGPGGLMTSHHLFEIGVAGIIAPLSFKDARPTVSDLKNVIDIGPAELFKRNAREIAVLDMYKNYQRKGWTPKLASQVRHQLTPMLIKTVCLTWYSALVKANLAKLPK
jgi:hypothetical protein